MKNDDGRYMRPAAEKYMTAEMVKPFVWPETPVDKTPWDSDLFKMRETMMKDQDKIRAQRYKGNIALASDGKLDRSDEAYRKMARDLLEGKTKWENGIALDEKWEALAGNVKAHAIEVQKEEQQDAAAKDEAASSSERPPQ